MDIEECLIISINKAIRFRPDWQPLVFKEFFYSNNSSHITEQVLAIVFSTSITTHISTMISPISPIIVHGCTTTFKGC